MRILRQSRSVLALAVACTLVARADANPDAKPATQADIDRLEKEIAAQRKLIEDLVLLQQQYASALAKLLADRGVSTPSTDDSSGMPKPDVKPGPAKKTEPKQKAKGTVAGKVQGATDAFVYVDDFVVRGSGSASMKQEGKQFVPRVLVVQKGTRVDFPNMDAVFHNVFSITPDNSFDLGSYRKGDSKSVTMVNPGVVNVYCNMHSQMVGYILVVPNGVFTRVSSDGTYKLANVPAGHHRIVAWAPNAKAIVKEVDVGDATSPADFELSQGRAPAHTTKDGLPYGSYKE